MVGTFDLPSKDRSTTTPNTKGRRVRNESPGYKFPAQLRRKAKSTRLMVKSSMPVQSRGRSHKSRGFSSGRRRRKTAISEIKTPRRGRLIQPSHRLVIRLPEAPPSDASYGGEGDYDSEMRRAYLHRGHVSDDDLSQNIRATTARTLKQTSCNDVFQILRQRNNEGPTGKKNAA